MRKKISFILAVFMIMATMVVITPVAQSDYSVDRGDIGVEAELAERELNVVQPGGIVGIEPMNVGNGFEGWVDHLDGRRISGWGWRPDSPHRAMRVRFEIYRVNANGTIGSLVWKQDSSNVIANQFRQDLFNHTRARGGTGNYGFSTNWNIAVRPGLIVPNQTYRLRVYLVDPQNTSSRYRILNTDWTSPYVGAAPRTRPFATHRNITVRMDGITTAWANTYQRGIDHWNNSSASSSNNPTTGVQISVVSNNTQNNLRTFHQPDPFFPVGQIETFESGTPGLVSSFNMYLNTARVGADTSRRAESTVVHEFGHAFWLRDNPSRPTGLSRRPQSIMDTNRNRDEVFRPQPMDINHVLLGYQFANQLRGIG